MKTFMDGGIKVSVDSSYNLRWLSFAKQKLAGLDQLRELSGVPSLAQKHIPENGIIVHVRVSEDSKKIEIIRERVDGFLFHPRSGEIDWKAYTFWAELAYRTVQFPYIKGSGWKPNGDPLLWSPVEYPLADGDKGTRNVRRRWSGSRKWKYIKNPPENYGNLDWKGWDVGMGGDPPDEAPILTWKGPPSRYFAEGLVCPATQQLYYGTRIYQGGEVVGDLPAFLHPKLSVLMPCYVLGAALTKDRESDFWKVCVAQAFFYDEVEQTVHYHFLVAAQRLSSRSTFWYHEEDYPDGWCILYENPSWYAPAPFHFNASGTEASAVFQWDIHTIGIDINDLSASHEIDEQGVQGRGKVDLVYSPGEWIGYSFWASTTIPAVDANGNRYRVGTQIGTFVAGDEKYYQSTDIIREEESRAVCAIDYVGDAKRIAEVEFILETVSSRYNSEHTRTPDAPTTVEPHVCFHLFYDSRNGKKYSRKIVTKMHMPNRVEEVYFETYSDDLSARSIGSTPHGDPPPTYLGMWLYPGYGESESKMVAGIVSFMDLRHDILVLIRDTRETSSVDPGDYSYNDGVSGWVQKQGEPEATSSRKSEALIKGYSEKPIPFFDGLVFSDDDENIWYREDTIPGSYNHTYEVTRTHFRFSNQPFGSWAVDRQGNHFYSMLIKDGVYNYLTGGEPVSLTKTPGDNPVFFPVAPV